MTTTIKFELSLLQRLGLWLATCIETLAKGVQSSCAALTKVGGVDKRFYLGAVDDIATVTFGGAGVNSVLTLTFKADKGLVHYSGDSDGHSADNQMEAGTNVNIRNHIVNANLGIDTAEQLGTLDDMLDKKRLFAILETRAGQLEVYGLNKVNFDSFGMKATAIALPTGVVLNDSTRATFTLTGGMTNLKLIYKPAQSLSANIAELDLLTIDPLPA